MLRLPIRLAHVFALSSFTVCTACAPVPTPSSSTPTEAWNYINEPRRFGLETTTLDALPRSGSVDKSSLWSGDYWPTYKGGIAQRWQSAPRNTTDYRRFQYQVMTPEQAARLTPQQIAALSPAEKYDLLTGRNDFPLTRAEWSRTVASARDGQVPTWYGLCHGWAAAALADLKPGAQAVMRTPDGRSVTFYSADLQALASYLYGDVDALPTVSIGARCNDVSPARDAQGRVVDPACRDTNPASFHLTVIGAIAAQRRPFVMDTAIAHEVWNSPLFGFRYSLGTVRAADGRDPLAAYRAPGTTHLVDVTMTVDHAVGRSSGRNAPQLASSSTAFYYTLELDAQRKIIGGEWRANDRPDFLWRATSEPTRAAGGYVELATVRELVALSRGNTPTPTPDPPPPPTPDDRALLEGRMLSIANTQTAPYLTRVVGMTFLGSRRVVRNRPYHDYRELAVTARPDDLAALEDFARRNP